MEEILKKQYHGTFENFYINLLTDIENDIYKKVHPFKYLLTNEEYFIENLVLDIHDKLQPILFRALLLEFYKFKSGKVSTDRELGSSFNYYKFEELIKTKEFEKSFWKKYPYLFKMTKNKVNNLVTFYSEVLNNISNDILQIEMKFGLYSKKINYFGNGVSGDSHCNGKSVLSIQFEDKEVIYKPHNLNNDLMLEKLWNVINQSLKYKITNVKTLSINNHGYQEKIRHQNCNNEQQIRELFYRIGCYVCIFYILKSDDMHYENVITNSSMPYIIDMETITSNKAELFKDKSSILQQYLEEIHNSVLGSIFLPGRFKFSLFDFDLSPLTNTIEESNMWKSYGIMDKGTDAIRLEKYDSPIDKSQANIRINDESINPFNYKKAIINGFTDVFDYVFEHKTEILNIISSSGMNEIYSRQVLRPSSVYAKFLDAVTHPYYSSDEKKVENIFNLFYKHDLNNSKDEQRVKQEVVSLKQGDIPYFIQTLDSKDLVCNDSLSINNYFFHTPYSVLENSILNLSKYDKKKQIYYINISLSTIEEKSGGEADSHITLFNIDRLLNNEIEMMINAEEKGTMIIHENREDGKVNIAPISPSLYDSAALILLFLEKYRISKDRKFLTSSIKLFNGMMEVFPIDTLIKNSVLSVYNGVSCYLYLGERLFEITKEKNFYLLMQTIIDKLGKTKIRENIEVDFVNGVSSCIYLLGKLGKKYPSLNLNRAVKNLFTTFEDQLKKQSIKLNGLAHGKAGISIVYATMYSLTKDKKYESLLLHYLTSENNFYMSESNNWSDLRENSFKKFDPVYWCHGAPGIGLSRKMIFDILLLADSNVNKTILNILNQDMKNSARKIISSGFSKEMDHSLCHGKCGNILILEKINENLKDSEISNFIQKKNMLLIEEIKRGNYFSGIESKLPIRNYMLGDFGILSFVMKKAGYKVPFILDLEID